jgi:hypothetical protein
MGKLILLLLLNRQKNKWLKELKSVRFEYDCVLMPIEEREKLIDKEDSLLEHLHAIDLIIKQIVKDTKKKVFNYESK